MQTFIDDVVRDLLSKQLPLSSIQIVLPNQRAGIFFKKSLAAAITQTTFVPQIISIEKFVESISGIGYADKIDLNFEFYKVYLGNTPSDQIEPIEKVLSWSSVLIQDFSNIDNYLIDPDNIFDYLTAIKELNHWSKKLEKTKNVSEYLQFWSRLKTYYLEFKKVLISKGQGYSGMVYREATKNIESFSSSQASGITNIFVGFNALNPAEEKIITHLLSHHKALIYWDADQHFLDNKWHDAGLFLRKYREEWIYYNKRKFEFVTNHYAAQKDITVTGTPNNIGQVKFAGKLLEQLLLEKGSLDDTAVVLGDEQLLLPLLNSLPKNIGPINVTMGLKLEYTPIADLFGLLFKLHKNQTKEFYYKEVLAIINHPFLRVYFNNNELVNEISRLINTKNIIYIGLEWLTEKFPYSKEELTHLFQPWKNTEIALHNCHTIILKIKQTLDFDKERNKLALEYSFRFHVLFNKLKLYVEKYPDILNISSLGTVYQSLINKETLDFQGEPLQGLQIMGMLETRLLDFKNLIILSVNEGILPAGKTENSFIPFDVKRENNLPTYMEMDAIFTYHFHRLLQRADSIILIYNSEPDALNGGEKSRFIAQLEFDGFQKIAHQFTAATTPSVVKELKSIPKTIALLERLKEIAASGFSPSSLTNYIRNPIDFYYEKVLNISEFDKVEETVAHNTLGTVIHTVLEILYTPTLGKALTVEILEDMKVKIPSLVEKVFQSEYQGGTLEQGKNLIIYEICKHYIQNFIAREITSVQEGNKIEILGLERRIKRQLDIKEFNFPIYLKGTVDRIDQYNGVTRIIDYKTGNVKSSELIICDWSDLTTDYEKFGKCFQILSYAYLLNSSEPFQSIEGGIISLKNLQNDPFMKFGIKENPRSRIQDNEITPEVLVHFENELIKLIREILNIEVPFLEKETHQWN